MPPPPTTAPSTRRRWVPINVPPPAKQPTPAPMLQLPTPAPSTHSEESDAAQPCALVRATDPLPFPCNQWKFTLMRDPLTADEINAVFANAERTLRSAGGGYLPPAAPDLAHAAPVTPYAITVRNGHRRVDLGLARGIVRVRFAATVFLDQVVLELLGRGIERACGVASEDSDSEDDEDADAEAFAVKAAFAHLTAEDADG
ncbi:uncharacterized protein LOC62_01G000105 [Vanrija pseudolonga]|uniref:Uncharacterized protein n=1 Tax=Vanrija pseudolonga TaxID=143232 RepID=A0AAF1BGM5_9TREE|nr:hypothetical protein LOC62_01G000105 [Vanrija pseudolonga]